jgi:hypothetical protein
VSLPVNSARLDQLFHPVTGNLGRWAV